MTEILSILAKSYMCSNPDGDLESNEEASTKDPYARLLSPLKRAIDKSPLKEQLSSTQQLINSKLIRNDEDQHQRIKLHKTIAENLFKEYPVFQNPKKKQQLPQSKKKSLEKVVSPFNLQLKKQVVPQNRVKREAEASSLNSFYGQNSSIKYTPQRGIKEQVQKFMNAKSSCLNQQTLAFGSLTPQLIRKQPPQQYIKKDKSAVKDQEKQKQPSSINNCSTSKLRVIQRPRQQLKNTASKTPVRNRVLQPKKQDLQIQTCVMSTNDLKANILQQPQVVTSGLLTTNSFLQEISQKTEGKQLSQQNYLSQSHYRSKSSQHGLKNFDLQSTQWLFENKYTPMLQLEEKRRRQKSMSQSPLKQLQQNPVAATASTSSNAGAGIDACNSTREKPTVKELRQKAAEMHLQMLNEDKQKPKSLYLTGGRSRNGMEKSSLTQTVLCIQTDQTQESLADIIRQHELDQQQHDYTFTMTPIQEQKVNGSIKESWGRQQLSKDKAKLGKDYTQYLLNKYQKPKINGSSYW